VAKRLGIPDGVLYTWASKFKKAAKPIFSDFTALQAEMVKLKAKLRHTNESSRVSWRPIGLS